VLFIRVRVDIGAISSVHLFRSETVLYINYFVFEEQTDVQIIGKRGCCLKS